MKSLPPNLPISDALMPLIGFEIAAMVFKSFYYVQEKTGIEVVGDADGEELIK
ncbi:hypothetical protein [Planococcus alpniumensis]|uniref:hypothetical protein n=1 Tax=Planococcus alpniumensis TaxID=2708345 RepID=UPI001B8D5D7B|nr:hypothetical protein [Planococcus sp. MSAK28401]